MFYFLVLKQQLKSITPFTDTKLDVIKWLSVKEISNSVTLRGALWSDVTMF